MSGRLARLSCAVLVTVSALVAGACGGSSTKSSNTTSSGGSSASGTTTVKVSYVPFGGMAPLKLGIEKGFFSKQGLKIEESQGVAPAPIMAQVVAGKVDIGFTTIAALVAAASNGAPLKVVSSVDGVVNPQQDPSGIMVKPDSGIKRPRDLEGKKVAVVALQSEHDVLLHEVVHRDGGNPEKVQAVQVPFAEGPTALKGGRVDAIVTTEPFMTLASRQGFKVINYPQAEVTPNGTVEAWVASQKFISEHPDVIRRFQAAMKASLDYAQAHPDEVRATVPKIVDIAPDLLKQMRIGMVFTPHVDRASVEKFVEMQQRLGFVKDPPAPSDLVAEGVQ